MVLIKNNGERIFELAWENQNYRLEPGESKVFSPGVARAILRRCPEAQQIDGPQIVVPPPPTQPEPIDTGISLPDTESPSESESNKEPVKEKKPVNRQDMRRLRGKSK